MWDRRRRGLRRRLLYVASSVVGWWCSRRLLRFGFCFLYLNCFVSLLHAIKEVEISVSPPPPPPSISCTDRSTWPPPLGTYLFNHGRCSCTKIRYGRTAAPKSRFKWGGPLNPEHTAAITIIRAAEGGGMVKERKAVQKGTIETMSLGIVALSIHVLVTDALLLLLLGSLF